MDKLKIYLAGKMSGLTFDEMNSWRKRIEDTLKIKSGFTGVPIEVINPVKYYNFEEKRHQTEKEVEEFDLSHVISSNIVIVNLDGLKDSVGTIIELHDAHYHNKIPVIAFGSRETYDKLHPWVQNNITRVEEDIAGVVNYIRDFYLI